MKKEMAMLAAGVILFTAGEIWLLAGETYDGASVPERLQWRTRDTGELQPGASETEQVSMESM